MNENTIIPEVVRNIKPYEKPNSNTPVTNYINLNKFEKKQYNYTKTHIETTTNNTTINQGKKSLILELILLPYTITKALFMFTVDLFNLKVFHANNKKEYAQYKRHQSFGIKMNKIYKNEDELL